MRYKLLGALVFITCAAQAQQVNPVPDYVFANRMSVGRNAVTDTLAYFSIGPRYGAIRGFMPPMVVDTALVTGGTKRNGLTIFSMQKNKYVYWDSVGSKWAEMAGTGGSAINSGDTATMLNPYTRGSGTVNYLPKFTGTRTIGNSSINDSATSTVITINQSKSIGINNATPSSTLTSIAGAGSDGIVINGANPSLVLNDTSGGSTGASFIGQRGADMYLETNGTGVVALRNNSLTRLGVNGQGEILIGPITDQGTFTLQNHNGIYAGGVVSMQMPGSSAIRSTGEIYIDGGTGGSGGFTVRTGSGFATRLQVSNDGEVYINNASDAGAYALQVAGSIYNTTGAVFAASSGNVGINNSSPLAPLHVGNGTTTGSTDPLILASRVINSGSGNSRAFSDATNYARSGGTAYASYDARISMTGTNNFGHYAAFQSGPTLDFTGTITDVFNYISAPTYTAGTVTNSYGTYIQNPVKTGATLTNNYGHYFASTFNAGTNNWVFYNASTERVYSGGDIIGRKFFAGSNSAATPSAQFHADGSGDIKLRLQQSGYNYWDFTSVSGQTYATISDVGGTYVTFFNGGNVAIGTTTDNGYKLDVQGSLRNTTTITTGAPTSGTAKPWRLGEAATVSPTSPNRTIRVEIDGTVYYLHAKTTND